MTLAVNTANEMRLTSLLASVKNGLLLPVILLSQYYSAVLNKDISTKVTFQLLNAQAAFALAVLPSEAPFLFRVFCSLWFALAVNGCKKGLKGCKRR